MTEAAQGLRPIIARRTGDEPIHHGGRPLPARVVDFWRWAYSDLLSNTTRGAFAEFIVAAALGLDLRVRDPWSDCDLRLPSGIRIEVRSAAFVQSWAQRAPSRITFSVRRSQRWDPDRGAYEGVRQHNADVFVFALLCECDRAKIDPLDVTQWKFFVLPTRAVESRAGNAQTLSMKRLNQIGGETCDFSSLHAAVGRAHASSSTS